MSLDDADDSKDGGRAPSFQELETLVRAMEDLQIRKVFELARRLKPGLTLEDMRNPHDFPELNDVDWHYEDGILTGIQSVLTAMRAQRRGS
jgi:hypothetical protein